MWCACSMSTMGIICAVALRRGVLSLWRNHFYFRLADCAAMMLKTGEAIQTLTTGLDLARQDKHSPADVQVPCLCSVAMPA